MSRLSKSVKKVATLAAPVMYAPTKGIVNALQGKNPLAGITDVLNAGSKPGVPNAYGPPDLSFLNNPIDLTKGYRPIDTGGTDAMFQDLLRNIGGQNQNDTAKLNGLLGDIGIDERNTVGNLKSDFADRGLGGPGMGSDIEAAGLAQARSDADRTRANARTATVGAGLDRLAGAYGSRYTTGVDTAKTNAATYNDLLKSGSAITSEQQQKMAQLLAELFTGGQKLNADTQKPGYLDHILSTITGGSIF